VGTVTVATPGTRVQVATSGNAVSAVSFKARASNAGAVYVGDETVSSSAGYRLEPGDEVTFTFKEVIDLRRFYVDAATANDKVDFAGVAA
jgi:plastocyanin